MIKYALICECDAEFEGWFPSSTEFDRQRKNGLVMCPMCDSTKVAKAVMAPNIGKKSTSRKNKKSKVVDSTNSVQYASSDIMMARQAKTVLRKINKYVQKNFENVGKKFYKEVKKAEAGKRDEKFYGTPSNEEVNKMLDEGIDLFHVPKVKDN